MTGGVPLALLGSTGSVGCQALTVLRRNPGVFSVRTIAAGRNVALLSEQVDELRPELVCVADEAASEAFRNTPAGSRFQGRIAVGSSGLCEAVTYPGVEAAVVALTGFAAFEPVIAALKSGKHLALANKECVVSGGAIVARAMSESSALVVPVDSEHNSIYQCLERRGTAESVRRIVITASGGPFLETPLDALGSVTPEMAVRHPRWNMGKKISVDSATLMNKGLEVIEASVLFGLDADSIEVLVHPESVVHGLVEYGDGTLLAALYEPDMRVPIAYALKVIAGHLTGGAAAAVGPPALESGNRLLDLGRRGALRFLDPDPERFPALPLAYRALRAGRGAEAVLNAANEVAVQTFLDGSIGFSEIVPVVSAAVRAWEAAPDARSPQKISDVIFVDSWGRKFASEHLAGLASFRGKGKGEQEERAGRAGCQ